MLISYVARCRHAAGTAWTSCPQRHLGHKPITFSEVAGTGKAQISFDQVPIDRATAYAAEDADVTLRLWRVLKPRLVAERHGDRLRDAGAAAGRRCSAAMEARGITVDRQILSRLSGDSRRAWRGWRTRSTSSPARRFNVGSPKQLGDILFGKMGLPGAQEDRDRANGRRRRSCWRNWPSRATSCRASILDWRQLSKLKSTYTDALPALHATRDRAACTPPSRWPRPRPAGCPRPSRTCRTSRSAPRRAARSARPSSPTPGNKLISADYSQIELRAARPHRRHPAAASRPSPTASTSTR